MLCDGGWGTNGNAHISRSADSFLTHINLVAQWPVCADTVQNGPSGRTGGLETCALLSHPDFPPATGEESAEGVGGNHSCQEAAMLIDCRDGNYKAFSIPRLTS